MSTFNVTCIKCSWLGGDGQSSAQLWQPLALYLRHVELTLLEKQHRPEISSGAIRHTEARPILQAGKPCTVLNRCIEVTVRHIRSLTDCLTATMLFRAPERVHLADPCTLEHINTGQRQDHCKDHCLAA